MARYKTHKAMPVKAPAIQNLQEAMTQPVSKATENVVLHLTVKKPAKIKKAKAKPWGIKPKLPKYRRTVIDLVFNHNNGYWEARIKGQPFAANVTLKGLWKGLIWSINSFSGHARVGSNFGLEVRAHRKSNSTIAETRTYGRDPRKSKG